MHKYAKEGRRPLIKNGKFFVAPQKTGDNFKVLFSRLAATGAGRPVDEHGFADGPWTPEMLADAISSIDANKNGIELRAVQVWFQDNYNGISDANIRWLARIFGCDDPEATSQWQAELRAAKDRLTRERRERNKSSIFSAETQACAIDFKSQSHLGRADLPTELPQQERLAPGGELPTPEPPAEDILPPSFCIARKTERIFSSESSLTLPLSVFSGACALALIAFSINLHSVRYATVDEGARQVGFLWAPNWTIVFLALVPLYLAMLIELMNRWLEEWRPLLLSYTASSQRVRSWHRGLSNATYSFWVTFFATVVMASLYNWIVTHLMPLLENDPGGWPIDWGRIAIVRPNHISIQTAIVFSAIAFVYNGFAAYLFFSGLIFMHLMKTDFAQIVKSIRANASEVPASKIHFVGLQLMTGVFRCTAIGVVITIVMKSQSGYLQSSASNILEWFWSDLRQMFGAAREAEVGSKAPTAAPGFIYSFLCVLAIVGTFISVQLKIRLELYWVSRIKHSGWWSPWTSMNICMTLLVTSYLAVGLIPGFTVLSLLSLLMTVYLISIPVEWEAAAIAQRNS